jgi:hypothetical protein
MPETMHWPRLQPPPRRHRRRRFLIGSTDRDAAKWATHKPINGVVASQAR